MTKFVQMLRQLAIEFDAFGESAVSRAVFAELETIALPLVLQPGETIPRTVTAGTFLRACVPLLLERRRLDEQEIAAYQDAGISMLLASDPNQTPEALAGSRDAGVVAGARCDRDGALVVVLAVALGERFKTVKGRAGRFDVAGARYQIRAFLRVKPECGCPTRTIWSDYSEPFTIAPWYEGSGAPPVQVPLPDATDRNLLKSLKPNVAFVVPPALNNLLGGSARRSRQRQRQRIAHAGPAVDLRIQHPAHHDLRVHRPQYLPVAVRPDLPLDVVLQDLHPVPEDRRRQ